MKLRAAILFVFLVASITGDHNDDDPLLSKNSTNKRLNKVLANLQRITTMLTANQMSYEKLMECELSLNSAVVNNQNRQKQISLRYPSSLNLTAPKFYQYMNNLREYILTYFNTELERNHGVIEELKSTVSNLNSDSSACKYNNENSSKSAVKYKRATDCFGLNLTGIVLVEYENTNLDVYCESNWLLIQRRQHGYGTNFNRTWMEYKNGFGSLRGEFWLGNEIVHRLTNTRRYQLRIELIDWSDNLYTAEYDLFRLDNEENYYRLFLSKTFKGNASRDLLDDLNYGLSAHNNTYFQTHDRQHEPARHQHHHQQTHKKTPCAVRTGGAWWFLNHTLCLPVNLNGVYIAGASSPPTKGIKWLAMNNYDKNYSLKKSKMKIKPV